MHFKKEKCFGAKFSKQRLIGLAAGNALCQKLPSFIIDKADKPRCFKNLKHLPCCYRGQKNVRWICLKTRFLITNLRAKTGMSC